MFENLKKIVLSDAEQEKAAAVARTASDDEHGDRWLYEYSTKTRWAAYQAGKLPREQAVKLAAVRARNRIEKQAAAALDRLEWAAAVPAADWLTIRADWVRSSVWGHDPHAETISSGGRHTGRASGYGYDKLSTAVATALNDDPAIMHALFAAADSALADKADVPRTSCNCRNWSNILPYGAGYGMLPAFEGGVGITAQIALLAACGLSLIDFADGKTWDYYSFQRGAK